MLMSNHPGAVALFFALSSLPLPVIVFPADARTCRSSPPVPAGTPLFLPPSLHAMAPMLANRSIYIGCGGLNVSKKVDEPAGGGG
jgi:hypothetical protein